MLLPSIFQDHFQGGLFEEMFHLPFQRTRSTAQGNALMSTDIQDLGKHYQLEMELPGYEKQDIKASLHDGYLTVLATTQTNNDTKDQAGNYIRKERYSGSCQRTFYVGPNLKEGDIQASFDQGLLKLTFPKEEHREAIDEKTYIAIQ